MTGHHAGHHPRSTAPAADHRLDQFAAAVAEARATNPAIAGLAATEDQFIEAAMDIGAHLDRQTVGAAWLILGQLFGTNLASVAPEQQAGALAMLLNVAKLAGQRLYTGDRLPVEMPCPFTYANGAPCKTVIKAPNADRAEVLLNAHAWQQHPGQERPATLDEGFPAPPTGPTYDEARRYASIRVYAEYLIRAAAEIPDPITGKTCALDPREAWEHAARLCGEQGVLRSRHAPHEVRDCRPGETYHCAADGEAQP